MERDYQICTRCIMDTSDPEITFDEEGVCNHCRAAEKRLAEQVPPVEERPSAFAELIQKVKENGRGKEYDCIIGVSGGVDSSYVAYLVKEAGLRPLAVHFDNGWNTELAVHNIKTILDNLDIELYTYVVDWEEFKDIQLSFLKASLANCEAPTDHGMKALLMRMAAKYRLRYILNGGNLATESILPYSWGHYNQDYRLLRHVHKTFGTVPMRTLPTLPLVKYVYNIFVRGIRQVPMLNLVEYDKQASKTLMSEKLGWRDYGGKHYESIWTRFFQGHYLVEKFGYDKRRAHLSSMIVSGLMTRSEALKEMAKPPYDPELLKQDKAFVLKKFGLSEQQWQEIMDRAPKEAREYPSNYLLFHELSRYKNQFRRIATSH